MLRRRHAGELTGGVGGHSAPHANAATESFAKVGAPSNFIRSAGEQRAVALMNDPAILGIFYLSLVVGSRHVLLGSMNVHERLLCECIKSMQMHARSQHALLDYTRTNGIHFTFACRAFGI